jgi:uncharacterized protein
MVRVLFYALLIYFGYLILKSLAKAVLRSGKNEAGEGSSPENTELIKDPQCGAYFLRQRGVAAQVEGKTVFFCSEGCRDGYIRDQQQRSGRSKS